MMKWEREGTEDRVIRMNDGNGEWKKKKKKKDGRNQTREWYEEMWWEENTMKF